MTPVGFEPTISASELDNVAAGIGVPNHLHVSNSNILLSSEKETPLILYPSQYRILKHE
jgi:hypothetical protein